MIHLILPDQLQELHALASTLAPASDPDSTHRTLVDRFASILDVSAGLLEKRGGAWRAVATSGGVPDADILGGAWDRQRAAAGGTGRLVTAATVTDLGSWTYLPLHQSRAKTLLLTLGGDWTLSERLFEEFAARVSVPLKRLELQSRRTANPRAAAAYALSRRLARVREPSRLYQLVVDRCARAVGAEKASIAVYDEGEHLLVISATHGYPAVLVRHLRFAPGAGIIGSVFLAGRPLRVEDVRRQIDLAKTRLRYRTPSFMSVPLIGVGGVIGVVNVADRRDAQPFDRANLGTMRELVGVAALAVDRMRAIERAEAVTRAAAIDPLSGLFNRRHFLIRLEEEIERARRQQAPLTALMLDVDNFKQLNDRLGHLGGDAVLRAVGDVLRRSVRLFDVCARFGGDEFAIIMPGSTVDSSLQIAERIRQDVEGSRPTLGPWSDELKVTASIGIATAIGTTGEELISRADQALYVAKREGKNRVRLSP